MLESAAKSLGMYVNDVFDNCECTITDEVGASARTLTLLDDSSFFREIAEKLRNSPQSYMYRVEKTISVNGRLAVLSTDCGCSMRGKSVHAAYAACCAAMVLKEAGAVHTALAESVRESGGRLRIGALHKLAPYTKEGETAELNAIAALCGMSAREDLAAMRVTLSLEMEHHDGADRSVGTADNIRERLLSDPMFAMKWCSLEYINAGAYGCLFRAAAADGREYALKVMNVGDNTELTEKAMNESSNVLRFASNEYTVKMYDFGISASGNERFIWIAMELLEAVPCEISDEKEVVRMACDVCRALEGIHSSGGMAHRDVKPSNILRASDRWKLCDFGITRPVQGRELATVIGTVDYMAPELLSAVMNDDGFTQYNNTVDIYALGLSMYTLLNRGTLPFLPVPPYIPTLADQKNAKVRRLRGEPFPRAVNCSEGLMRIINKACAPNPSGRFGNASRMREVLEDYLDD